MAELISLIDMLVEKKYLVPIPHHFGNILVVGRKEAKYATIGKISLDQGQEFILGENDKRDLVNNNGQQTHWTNTFSEQHCQINHIMHSWYAVSEELKELEEEGYDELLYAYYHFNSDKKAFIYLKKLATRYPNSRYAKSVYGSGHRKKKNKYKIRTKLKNF